VLDQRARIPTLAYMNEIKTLNGSTFTTTATGTVAFLRTGINGSGHETWAVQSATKASPNKWLTETFTTQAEALNWMRWI